MWVNIKYSLPEKNKHVLLYGTLYTGTIPYGKEVLYEGYLCERDNLWHNIYDDVDYKIRVTHWMNLPDKPTTGNGG